MDINKKQKIAVICTLVAEVIIPILIVCGIDKKAMASISIALVFFCFGQFGMELTDTTPKGFIYWFAKMRSGIWYMLSVCFLSGFIREDPFDLSAILVFVGIGILAGTFEYFVQLESGEKES